MNHAPDHLQFAYAKLVELAFVYVRNGAIPEKEQLHDLGDALHNVSGILTDYGSWVDDAKFRELYLRPYDQKWGQSVLNLEKRLEDFIALYKSGNHGD